jgi:hypothetical protein
MSEQEFSEPTLDTEGLQAYIAELTAEQNMVTAIIAGTATAVVCAGIWGAVTVATGYQIGFMALGVGFLVGHSVRVSGKGMTKKFQVLGGFLALFGCLAGNLTAFGILIANQENAPVANLLFNIFSSPVMAFELLKATLDPMDFLFYGIAVYEGYRFSLRGLSNEEVTQFITPAGTT